MPEANEKDREQIINHIHSIFKAFLKQDRETLRETHANDWVGFLGPSTSIERGIEAYMANAEKSLQNFTGTGYELLDVEVKIHGDVGIVYYVARYDYYDSDGNAHTLPLRSIDVYRRDGNRWIQAGSHIAVIPNAGAWGEGEQE